MQYIDGFRNSETAAALCRQIAQLAADLPQERKVRVMEVCGSHTMAIARYGIRSVLPDNVALISGPGCPVCVTDSGYIDAAIELAGRGVVIATFGDMMKVPGSSAALMQCCAEDASVNVCYSPLDALELAKANPESEVVFLAIGFETTIGPVISIIEQALARSIKNVSLLTAFKVIPPAMEILAADKQIKIDAFLCPAHVSAIIGAKAYQPLVARFALPCVIAGFEPLDILLGIKGIVTQIARGEARVENQYNRVVKEEGNVKAQTLISKYLEPADVGWRGLGVLPQSGLVLKGEFSAYDAEKKHGLKVRPGKPDRGCRCGDVLKGIISPPECGLFGKKCTPRNPVGPCMVSSEGSCSAHYKYQGVGM
jgi:hydrogenase expression/formation protein HypD